MNTKVKGFAAGVLAAIFYGTNPLGSLPLYADSITPGNVLFYRYGLAAVCFALWLLARGQSLKIGWGYAIKFAVLGSLFALSSITLYVSFKYMSAGIASTILFSYPIMTALFMVLFYHERVTLTTVAAISLAVTGIGLLYHGGGDDGGRVSTAGMMLVLMSSLLFALYIVYVKQFRADIGPMKFTFWVVLFGWLTIMVYMIVASEPLQVLQTGTQWLWALQLALLPTVFSLFFINVAIKSIGSTPTAILGAFEPVTAVVVSCLCFGEPFTLRLAVGIVLILAAVILIIIRRPS